MSATVRAVRVVLDVLAVLAIAALTLAWGARAARAQAPPEAYGPLAVQVSHVQIAVPLDPNGPEGVLPTVAADLYVPGARGPWPLIELSHAWPGTLHEFPLSGWAKRLASRGFVVIVSDRRGGTSAAAVNPALDQPVDLADLSTEVNSEDILRVLRWAIAQSAVPGSALDGMVDPGHVAIAGHSLGGYYDTYAAVKALSEGPRLSALVLLDPSDERLGTETLQSSLPEAASVTIPTAVLASEENQHPVMCNMTQGSDCTLVAPQEYAALVNAPSRLGLKVVGAVHEDVEDPSTVNSPSTPGHLQMFERYGMAWLEFWAGRDCSAAPYLGGPAEAGDQSAGSIAPYAGATPPPACP